jgi:hypothetical protein
MPGRPRALDEVKRREVCALVSAGCGIDGAARYVGCNAITIRRESLRNPEFCEQLRNAELNAQNTPLQRLPKAAGTQRRAASMLKPTRPDQFARREPNVLSAEDVKIWVEKLVKSKFDRPNDSEIVDRMLRRFDAVVAECERDSHAGEAAPPDVHSRRRRPARGLLNRDAANEIGQNGTPFCFSDSENENGNPNQ